MDRQHPRIANSVCLISIIAGVLSCTLTQAEEAPARIDFVRHVHPVLAQCIKCHGPEKQQGGLRLDVSNGLIRAGDSGSAAVVPGDASASELIRRVESADHSERMPPEGAPLSVEQIRILRSWIEQGAHRPETPEAAPAGRGELAVTDEDRRHWSYRPLGPVKPPAVRDRDWCETTIDHFVLAALEANGLRPGAKADRRTLIRRVYFDLIGLPPTPEQVESFVADSRESAYESLVDELLNSPHYGERWGRH
ncbi:MAG: DUF1549 domain-containing protein, partial [Planctomycetaceae bacterium]|nr:DUF1549 domain-containing protein [Planctomycetaceae bacterium]